MTAIVEGKILPPEVEVSPTDPPIFLLQALPTWAPWLPDGGYQRVPIGSAGQVLTVNADGSVGWSNSSAGFGNPMTTTGDMIYSSPGSTPVALHIGANGTVLTVVSGVPSWTPNSAVGFTNPMTTSQDLIVGGASPPGVAGRLGVGANNQVLGVTGGLVGWINNPAGFTSPMTTAGDIIFENNSLVPARLGVGANNQVLTVSGGLPTWQNSQSGFNNPMTAAGDMITALNATTATRLPIGANGQILTVVSGAPAWAAGPAGASAVVFPSGDTTGVTDQAAITATWTSGPVSHGGEVLLANGAFYVKPASGLNCLQPPAQTVVAPQGSNFAGSPVCIRGLGAATIVYPVGAGVTGIWYHRTTSYGQQYGLAAQPQTGYIRDFTLDGSLATGASTGLDYGDGWGYEFNLGVVNFATAGATAVRQINRLFWTEKCERIRFRLSNNTTAFYITTNLAPSGDHSSEYNMYDISMFCQANQQGIVVDGVNMGGSYMWIRGNMSASNITTLPPPGNIAALSIINAAGVTAIDGHRWYAGGIYMKVEANPGNGVPSGTPPYCMYSDGVGYVRQCVVSINGSQLTSSNWNGAEFSAEGNISADPGLLAAQTSSAVYAGGNANPNGFTVVGNVAGAGTVAQFTNTGLSPTGPPILMQGAQSGDHMLGIQVTGDSNPRWKVDVGGDTLWGSGSAVQDVDLGRNAAGVLLVGGGTANTANLRLGIAGSGRSVLSLAESSSAPSTIASTGVLYVASNGSLHYLSPAGTDTQIGPP